MECPECGKEVIENSKTCSNCGYTFKKKNNKKIFGFLVFGLIIIILFITHIICIHKYSQVSCTEDSVCIRCNKVKEKALGHDWIDATCETKKTCSRCGKTSGETLGHEWISATCTESEYCKRCGKEGKKAIGHKWKEATCSVPKTCEICKIEEGNTKSHIWQAANCGYPKTCKICKKTEGKTVGEHKWREATYSAPKTCEVCKKTEGKALEYGTAEKYYKIAYNMTKYDLGVDNSGTKYAYKYNGKYIPLLNEDNEWINTSWNTGGTVNAGAVYRKIAKSLIGTESGLNDYEDYAELVLGFTPDTKEEFMKYQKNIKKFICEKNTLINIMKKFETLDCVEGSFNFNKGKFGEFDFIITDITACAKEMEISEEMLGFIFGELSEYWDMFEFEENSVHISYSL